MGRLPPNTRIESCNHLGVSILQLSHGARVIVGEEGYTLLKHILVRSCFVRHHCQQAKTLKQAGFGSSLKLCNQLNSVSYRMR